MMTKAEWEEAYKEFSKARSELSIHEHEYEHGSNKKKRADADRQMGYGKDTVRYLFKKYPEVYILATGGEKNSEFGRAVIVDEFFQNRYIVGDLRILLFNF